MRDTDTDWTVIGDFEPYYGVLSHEKFLRRNLNDETLNEFWQSGTDHIDHVRARIVRYFGDFQASNAIDFGSGVGRLTRGLSSHCEFVTGVDVSAPMLAEARRRALPNMSFFDEIPDGPFDWVNSAIVFQHIHPDRGYGIFQRLLDVASPNAVLSVHFMAFKDRAVAAETAMAEQDFVFWDGDGLRGLVPRDLPAGFMSMYDYDLNRLIAMMVRANFTSYVLEHANHGGCHGVEILSKRG